MNNKNDENKHKHATDQTKTDSPVLFENELVEIRFVRDNSDGTYDCAVVLKARPTFEIDPEKL